MVEKGEGTPFQIYVLLLANGGENRDFPILASSRLPLAQSNPYANMVYLGVAYPGTLQKQSWLLKQRERCCRCWVTSVVSNSVRPHRRQPAKLPHPWEPPGKNTEVGCHFLLQQIKKRAQICKTEHHKIICKLNKIRPPCSDLRVEQNRMHPEETQGHL